MKPTDFHKVSLSKPVSSSYTLFVNISSCLLAFHSDMELLEACRAEFHRRLKVYHAWKTRNKKNPAAEGASAAQAGVTNGFDQRAPEDIMHGKLN